MPLLGLRRPLLGQTRPKSERRDLIVTISSERVTAGRPVNAQCRWVAPAGRRLAGVSRASVRSFVKYRPDYTCSNDTPALQPPATTAPVRAVPCWQDTTLVLREAARCEYVYESRTFYCKQARGCMYMCMAPPPAPYSFLCQPSRYRLWACAFFGLP